MHDDKTPHLSLPLPHPAVKLETDVFRLREALTRLDKHLSGIDALLAVSAEEELSSVREIVAAVKAAQADLAALNALVEIKVTEAATGLWKEIERLRPLIYAGL